MPKKKTQRTGRNAKRGSFPREKAVLVPFHPEEKARLDQIARFHDLSRPSAIRMLVDAEFYRIKLPSATLQDQSVSTPA